MGAQDACREACGQSASDPRRRAGKRHQKETQAKEERMLNLIKTRRTQWPEQRRCRADCRPTDRNYSVDAELAVGEIDHDGEARTIERRRQREEKPSELQR